MIEDAQRLPDGLRPLEKARDTPWYRVMEAADMAWEAVGYQMKIIAKQRGRKFKKFAHIRKIVKNSRRS